MINIVGLVEPLKNLNIHISASLSRQPLVKGERSVRFEMNAAMSVREKRNGPDLCNLSYMYEIYTVQSLYDLKLYIYFHSQKVEKVYLIVFCRKNVRNI